MLEFMTDWNLIEFFNWILGPGFGELIILTTFIGFVFNGAVALLPLVFTRGITIHHIRARAQNRLLARQYTPDGLMKYLTLPKDSTEYQITDKRGVTHRWEINAEGIEREPNGVRSTIFYPRISFNVTVHQLSKFFADENEEVLYDAKDQAKFIDILAHADATALEDASKKWLPLMIGAGFIIAIGVCIYIIFYALGQMDMCSAMASQIKTSMTPTTVTLPPIQ